MAIGYLLIGYLLLLIPIAAFDVDWHLAEFWFEMEGGQWSLKHDWLFQTVMHDFAHDAVVTLYVLILLTYILSFFSVRLAPFKRGLGFLSLSVPLATLTVSLFKRLTFVDCPWSVADFAGNRPYEFWLYSLFSPIHGAGHCFPAGHASSAYMLFGLYFFCRAYWPQHALKVLLSVIALGLLFGFAQQLRGAHFISHDITSALICWTVTALIWRRFLPIKTT